MGLAGMLGSCTRLIRYIVGNALFATFCVVYLVDMCEYSTSMDEHVEHLRTVLSALCSAELYVNPRKRTWTQKTPDFELAITLDPAKTEAIKTVEEPSNTRKLQRFLGMCGYYRRFLPAYAELVQPLLDSLKSTSRWIWGPLQTAAFARVKELLQCSHMLRLPDFTQPFLITTDASDIAEGVLSQVHSSGEHPVAYLSRKLSDTERRWPAHEKEVFAIQFCLERWRPYLLEAKFTVYTDSIACKWFFTKKKSSPKLLRLTHSASIPSTFFIARTWWQTRCLDPSLPTPCLWQDQTPLQQNRSRHYCVTILQRLQSSAQLDDRYSLAAGLIVEQDGRRKRVFLPRDDHLLLEVLVQYHDETSVAHPGVVRTYLTFRQDFIWPIMRSMVEDYVCTCETCIRNKSGEHKKCLLQPLPIPEAPWVDIAMDLVTGLPMSGGFDVICVVVCRLSKRDRYLPTRLTESDFVYVRADLPSKSFSNVDYDITKDR
ncbi:LOW QUALITY PROTEIN: Retrotransposable element [Phytophthora megakarya]|uniref:Retrotransposable element n=1 Tax=Phytophthora megakarya TaxID=4795 RepID=A0A225WHP0_9STRA|nr:LOW QUALITY PROTEIN: Retrotransposable element [Phytophthora megakarya]